MNREERKAGKYLKMSNTEVYLMVYSALRCKDIAEL